MLQKKVCLNMPGSVSSLVTPTLGHIIYRGYKHWNPKFRKLRSQKMVKVKLPDFEDLSKPYEQLTKEEVKTRMKDRGILPDRPWVERPLYISSTASVFEPYIPPEGDGKVSVISAKGAKQKLEFIEKKSRSMMALRKIRTYEEGFEFSDFLKQAQDIYINSHLAMINKDRDKLSQYVTERAYPEVVNNIGDKTINWKFVQSIEPPRVVHVRCTDVITKENIFSQITVRFHTQQILAVYDRFGRLFHGSETIPKDVLEYVVFEKHLSNEYGTWRVHDKIIPNWMPARPPLARTHVVPPEPSPPPEDTVVEEKTVSKSV